MGAARGTDPTWDPSSKTAGITGPVAVGAHSVTMDGKQFPLTLVRHFDGTELANAAKLFSMTPSGGAVGALYRIAIPATTKFRNDNTFCGTLATTYVVMYEGLQAEHGAPATLSIAGFSGAAEPDLTPSAIGQSHALCGTMSYTRPTASPLPS